MTEIRVIDARMGRGKTSAAESYMASCSGSKRFMYITPYLDEVDRICNNCTFDQPEDGDHKTKTSALRQMILAGKNISATHALFYLMDSDMLELIRSKHYSLIIDEAIDPVKKVTITQKDKSTIMDRFAEVGEDGYVQWVDKEYDGKYNIYREMAESGCLYCLDSCLFSIMQPNMLLAFDEVTMMTYLFGGQYQKAYLEFFKLPYRVCGVNRDGSSFSFTDEPDRPNPVNYRDIIDIVTDDKINAVGDDPFALSKSWYDRRPADSPDIRKMRNNLNTFFCRRQKSSEGTRLWTCFKSDVEKFSTSRVTFRRSYIQPTLKATNKYRDRTCVAYLINRFADPNIIKFFAQNGVVIDTDEFALGEMLQFIWRSAVRDGKKITLYIPSRRMRELLIHWIESNSEGGCDPNGQTS